MATVAGRSPSRGYQVSRELVSASLAAEQHNPVPCCGLTGTDLLSSSPKRQQEQEHNNATGGVCVFIASLSHRQVLHKFKALKVLITDQNSHTWLKVVYAHPEVFFSRCCTKRREGWPKSVCLSHPIFSLLMDKFSIICWQLFKSYCDRCEGSLGVKF